MAAGLGYKEFTTGDVLTAADANGYLASQVVMVFASSAARTSAIASPQEGMISYLKDTNSTEYYSGSTWVAIGGAASGDFTKITASTFSASSAVSIDNCFTSTYTNYRIIVNITSASASAIQRFRYRASGADNTAASYNGINEYFGASLGRFTSTAATSLYMYDSATNGNMFVMDILSPQVAEKTWYTMAAMQGSNYSVFGAGFFDASTQFDGITFYPASGTITGSIAIYGYGK